MRFPLDARGRAQIAQYRLRYACRHCAFYQPDDKSCVNGWPTDGQRDWPLSPDSEEVSFCKEFELG